MPRRTLSRIKRCIDYILTEDTLRYAFLFIVVLGAASTGILSNITLDTTEKVEALTLDNRKLALENRRLIFRINHTALDNCNDVEGIKEKIRKDTIEDFQNLDDNLRLLRIPKTEELVERVTREKNDTLKEFRREPCPRVKLNDVIG